MVISPLLINLLTKSHEPLSSENFRGLVPLQLFGSIGHGEGSADSQAIFQEGFGVYQTLKVVGRLIE